jgi:hypothetical protein
VVGAWRIDGLMYQRRECIAKASTCRENAQGDPANHDYWIDEAIAWHRRAIEARHENAVAPEIHDSRLIPK